MNANSICIVLLLIVTFVHLGNSQDVATARGGMTVTSFKVSNKQGEEAKIKFGSESGGYHVGLDRQGDFSIGKDDTGMLVISKENVLSVNTAKLSLTHLDVKGEFSVLGVPQFRMIHREDFSSEKVSGWDNNAVTQCAGVQMLGGYCKFAKGEVTKKFDGLPPHSELRVKAVFHFLDSWIGETGFMRMNIGRDGSLIHVWTERHSQDKEQNGVNVCGSQVSEGKFAAPIDLTVPHNGGSVVLGFGSTMDSEDACDESWGVSGVELYVR